MKKRALLIPLAILLGLCSVSLLLYVNNLGQAGNVPKSPQTATAQTDMNNTGKIQTAGGPATGQKSTATPLSSGGTTPNSTGHASGGNGASVTAAPQLPSNSVIVNVAVIGKNHELLFGPASVKITGNNTGGANALGALESTGLAYKIAYADFVVMVDGESNKGQSGWMFEVNNQVPSVSSSEKAVKSGDEVIWWYSSSLSSPSPSWGNW